MGLGKKFVNGLVKLGYGIGDALGLKWNIEVDEHKLYVELDELKDNIGKAYDRNHFVNGNIFIKGSSNPVKPVIQNGDVELVSSQRYKSLMRNKVIEDLIKSQEEEEGMTTRKIALLGLGVTALNMVVLMGVGVLLLMGA